LPCNSTI